MCLYEKSKSILRKTEWVILNKKNINQIDLINKIIDKSFYQRIIDPIKLMKESANEIWERTSLWVFIFFIISVILIVVYAQFNKYFSNMLEIGTFRNYAPLIIYFLAILFTYFLFAFRMPSVTREAFVSEKNINKIISYIQHDIANEKEADLIEKNLSDLAESAKRRKILIRIFTIAVITYMFKQESNFLFGISTILTFIVAVFFEMYAIGSRAIFANAKYAVREIALQYSNAKNNLQLSIENIDSHAS